MLKKIGKKNVKKNGKKNVKKNVKNNGKKNQYYTLIYHFFKSKKAKVYNFKINRVEIYFTSLTKKEKKLEKQKALELKLQFLEERKSDPEYIKAEKEKELKKIKREKYRKLFCLTEYYFILYNKYRNHKLYKFLNLYNNDFIFSFIGRNYFKFYSKAKLPEIAFKFILNRFYYLNYLKKIFVINRYLSLIQKYARIISIHIILRRNNIFVTIIKDNKTFKIITPCKFPHIPKSGKKKSMSFFYTVKRTIMYISNYFYNKKKKYFLKIFFKGFKQFREPLIRRFFFKKRLKQRCLGVYNMDFESFNGCRLRKSKRIKIRGQRKKKNKFSSNLI
jgi:hypothetical protein